MASYARSKLEDSQAEPVQVILVDMGAVDEGEGQLRLEVNRIQLQKSRSETPLEVCAVG